MNKIILFAGLIAGAVEPVYTGRLTPNLLDNVGTIYVSYNRDVEQYRTTNIYSAVDIQLMTIDYSISGSNKVLTISTLPAYEDYIVNFAINIHINDYYKFVLTNHYEYDAIDNTGFYNALALYIPYDFGDEFTPDNDAYPNEYGVFNVRFDDFDNVITDLKVSIDVLNAGFIIEYDRGYNKGYNEGHDIGYNEGYQKGEDNALTHTSFTDFLVYAVGGFMDFEIFPNFSIGNVFGALVAVVVAVILLRVFAGG